MQAAILAAGKSTRTYPLTLTRPKPLLKIANKTLLEHNLYNLNGTVNEVILVVGYKKEMIKGHIGNKYKGLKIKYVEQKQQLGTGHAAMLLEPHIKGRFILMMGDDVYSKQDIRDCAKNRYAISTAKTKNPQNFGVIVEKNNILVDFVEKPKKFVSDTISTAMYSLDKEIFYYLKKIKISKRDEIELPDAIKLLAKDEKIRCVRSKQWLPIGYPADLLKADLAVRKGKNSIGKNSKIQGRVINSSIGKNCTIRGTVKNSIIMDNSAIENSIIERSIIGENAYVDGKVLNSVIGDESKIKNSTIKNCKVWPNKTILNKAIEHDIK